MNTTLLFLIATQLLFTITDLLGRFFMIKYGFTQLFFFSWWFLFYMLLRTIATVMQLYLFSSIELGKTMALLATLSIIFANLLGYLVLKEILSQTAYIGISLAIIAFLVLAFG